MFIGDGDGDGAGAEAVELTVLLMYRVAKWQTVTASSNGTGK